MPVDILQSLTGGISMPIAATASGTAIDTGAGGALPGGTPVFGLVARVIVSDAHNATGANTLTFTMDHSSDNTNWKTLAGASQGVADDLTLSTTVQSREIFIPFETHLRYVRLTATIAGAGTVPAATFTAYLGPAMP